MTISPTLGVAATFFALAFNSGVAFADSTPVPASSPTPTPAAHGIELHGSLSSVFLTQGAAGPGLQPVDGPGFAQGAPAAPNTPYDLFSAAPVVPGNVQQNQFTLDALWHGRGLSIGMTAGAESLIGDRTNQAYWAEPLQPQDNPHLGTLGNAYSIVFPTHPGTDDYDGVRFGLNQVRMSLLRDALEIRGGWLDLTQTLPCVFTPAPTTNALPGLLLKPPESLNPNSPALDSWTAPPATLPLRGFDAVYNAGATTLEASDVQLPSLPGTPARLVSLSAGHFNDQGHGAIVQWTHAHTGGDPISSTAGFGLQSQIVATDQGLFTVSTINSQRETIGGARVVTQAGLGFDATAEYAHSTYQADGIGKSGSVGGSWLHGALSHSLGAATVGAHYYRFEPTFATMLLPYGTPEGVWSVAYSWPGPWLKSNFQLVDSTALGVNREGPLFSYSLRANQVQAIASYSTFRQITPMTTNNFQDLGFVEGFFLIQRNPADATRGYFRRTSAYVGKRYKFADVGLDFVDDGLHRDAAAGVPFDAVSYDAPQYVVSLSRAASPRIAVAAGFGYFGTRGSWADGAATNVDFGMHVVYAGAQLSESGRRAAMITVRRSVLHGMPFFGPLGITKYGSPDFSATTVLLEQRFQL